jgi:hypothetical protein
MKVSKNHETAKVLQAGSVQLKSDHRRPASGAFAHDPCPIGRPAKMHVPLLEARME